MTSSLDRKIEAAGRRAAEERAAKGMPPERFNKDDHQTDGTVKPTAHATATPAPAPAPAAPAKVWHRVGADWYQDGHPNLIYRTRDGLRPDDDGRNVIETLDKVVGTHVPDTVPGSVTQPKDATLTPKAQRMWVRDGLDWVDDNEDQCAFYFTRDGEPPAEDMANVDSIRTVKTITTAQAMAVVVDAVQNEIDVARSWHGELVACMFEHLGGQDNPVVVENVYAIAQLFMGRVFGISHDSELNKRPDVQCKSEPHTFPFISPNDTADAMAYGMEAWKHKMSVYCGIDIATPFEHGQHVMHARQPGKSWMTMGLYYELEQMYANHRRLALEALERTVTARLIEPEDMPSGNFGQRPPTTGIEIRARQAAVGFNMIKRRPLDMVNEEAAAVAASPALQAKLTMEQLTRMGHKHPEGTILQHEGEEYPSTQHYEFWGCLPGGSRIYRPKR